MKRDEIFYVPTRPIFVTPEPPKIPQSCDQVYCDTVLWHEFKNQIAYYIQTPQIYAYLITPTLDAYEICEYLKQVSFAGAIEFKTGVAPFPRRIELELRRVFCSLSITVKADKRYSTAYESHITSATL